MKDEHLDITNDLNSRLMTKLNNDKQVITYSDLSHQSNLIFYILKIEATNEIIKNIKIRSQNSEETISINKISDLKVYDKNKKPINIKEYIESELNAGSVIKSIEIICPSVFDQGITSPLPPEPEEFIFPVKTVLIIVAVMVTLGLGYKYIFISKNIKNTNIIMENKTIKQ
jgi:hypothetical protein